MDTKNLFDKVTKLPQYMVKSVLKFDTLLRKPCHLEIHLAEHCNLNCVGCTHYSPLAEPSFCDMQQLDENLQKLSKIQDQFDTIFLLGGEPLLNPDICDAMRIVRTHFKHANLKIITNGLLLRHELPEKFWQACLEYKITICFTKYPVKADYAAIEDVCQKHGVHTETFNQPTHFTLHKLNPRRTGSRLRYYVCSNSLCLNLVGNKLFSCSQSAYAGYLNKAFGTDFKHRKNDYLTIDNVTRFRFRRFLLTTRPFCAYCVFPRTSVDWKISTRKADEWIELQS